MNEIFMYENIITYQLIWILAIWLDEGKITEKAFERNKKIFNDSIKIMEDL